MPKLNQLLVMPRFVDKIGEWYNFPLGIPYISSSLKKAGFNVFTLNLNNIEGSIEDILQREIEEKNIDIIATGGLSFQYNAIKNILTQAKKIKKDIITIVGGGIITSAPYAAMQALGLVDFGIIGEGEITNCELSYALENGRDLNSIKGIIYNDGVKLNKTNPREECINLDDIPYPDYKGFGFDKILNEVASMQGINETNAITMLSSRSCPFRCTFCFHSSGIKYRQRSLDNFFTELDYLVKEYGIKYIFIADELFAYNMERVRQFCYRIKNYDIKWWAQFRVTDITPELVKLLKESNCVTMGFGLESADNRILKSMKKNITIEQTEQALKLVYEAGITIQGGFIFGDVEETFETASNTLEWWKAHRYYGISLNFITTYPGTELYNYACKSGVIKDEMEFIKQGCPTINVSKMSQQERAWLAEQIIRLPQTELEEPEDIREIQISYSEGNISFQGKCVECNHYNYWNNIRFFTRNVLTCRECGRKHKIPIIDLVVQQIDKNILNLLRDNTNVAFWGINDYFGDLSSKLKSIVNGKIFFVDVSQMKQGSSLNGKTIYSPQIIKEKNIKIIIIPAVAFFTSIQQQIRAEFKDVTHIINIIDLIKPMEY